MLFATPWYNSVVSTLSASGTDTFAASVSVDKSAKKIWQVGLNVTCMDPLQERHATHELDSTNASGISVKLPNIANPLVPYP